MTWVSAGMPGIAIAEVFGSRGTLGADHDRIRRQCCDFGFERVAQPANPP